MRRTMRTAAAAIAVLAALSTAALARQDRREVTIIRGPHSAVQNTAPRAAANPAVIPGPGPVDRSGGVNSLMTGSSNAGGEIRNPPPGAGG